MNRAPTPEFRRIVHVVALAIAALLAVRVLFRVALPTGSLTVKTDFVSAAPYMSDLKPNGRFDEPEEGEDGEPRTRVGASPVYIDLEPPFAFAKATVTLAYENRGRMPVELAALASTADNLFSRRVLEQPLLDGLSWKRVTADGLTLYQRTSRFTSVADFMARPPARGSVATMGVDDAFLPPFRLDGYAPSAERRELEVSLRGRHRLLVYVAGEPLDIAFITQDMNREAGEDRIEVVVRREADGEIVARAELPDDGNATADQRSSPLRTVPLTLPAPAEGVYRIEFASGDDVFIRRIATSQRKLVFEGAVYLGDHIGYSDRIPPVAVQVRGTRVDAITHHPESLQTVTVAGQPLALAETHVRVGRALPSGTAEVVSPKRDVVLETDGVIALSREDLFDPLPYRIGPYATLSDLDARGIDFILAAYASPLHDGPVTVASATYDLAGLDRTKDGAYRLAISLPALADAEQPFELRSLRVAFSRPPGNIVSAFQEFFLGVSPHLPTSPPPQLAIPDPVSFREYVP